MSTDPRAQRHADQFGRAVAARLAAGTEEISYEARERLRAARTRALTARKKPAMAPVLVRNRAGVAALALGGDDRKPSIFHRVASVLPLLLLAAGLVLIHGFHTDRRASELAAVDAALLTDDLPPAAYADPGFVQFLKQTTRAE